MRIHLANAAPEWYGPGADSPPTGRFDDPEGTYGVCYFGNSFAAAFAETLLRNPPKRLLSLDDDLRPRSVTTFQTNQEIHLVTFHGPGLARLGLTARDAHGMHAACRQWARRFYEHADAPAGIEYRSRHDDSGLCIALFDRARKMISNVDSEPLLANTERLRAHLRRYGVRLTR